MKSILFSLVLLVPIISFSQVYAEDINVVSVKTNVTVEDNSVEAVKE
jgi:hypothetical protein